MPCAAPSAPSTPETVAAHLAAEDHRRQIPSPDSDPDLDLHSPSSSSRPASPDPQGKRPALEAAPGSAAPGSAAPAGTPTPEPSTSTTATATATATAGAGASARTRWSESPDDVGSGSVRRPSSSPPRSGREGKPAVALRGCAGMVDLAHRGFTGEGVGMPELLKTEVDAPPSRKRRTPGHRHRSERRDNDPEHTDDDPCAGCNRAGEHAGMRCYHCGDLWHAACIDPPLDYQPVRFICENCDDCEAGLVDGESGSALDCRRRKSADRLVAINNELRRGRLSERRTIQLLKGQHELETQLDEIGRRESLQLEQQQQQQLRINRDIQQRRASGADKRYKPSPPMLRAPDELPQSKAGSKPAPVLSHVPCRPSHRAVLIAGDDSASDAEMEGGGGSDDDDAPWEPPCAVCGEIDLEAGAICDGCDRSYHLQCMYPPLKSEADLPEGDWFCRACVALTARKQPAVTPQPPRTGAFHEGDRVACRRGGLACDDGSAPAELLSLFGTVRYVGYHHEQGTPRIGVELDEPDGKNDGTVRGHRYFACDVGHGLLIKPTPARVKLL